MDNIPLGYNSDGQIGMAFIDDNDECFDELDDDEICPECGEYKPSRNPLCDSCEYVQRNK